jgi:hypothetical protein
MRVGFENQCYEELGALISRIVKPRKLIGQDLVNVPEGHYYTITYKNDLAMTNKS